MTVAVSITHEDWTIIGTGINGTISNFGERDTHLRESLSKPSANNEGGFVLLPSSNIPFSLDPSVSLWARSKIAPCVVYVSEFINSGSNPNSQGSLDNLSQQNKEIIHSLKAMIIGISLIANTTSKELNEMVEDC